MSSGVLRDDAERMLRFVAARIESAQTRDQEVGKRNSCGPALPLGRPTAACEPGISRAADRLALIELMSEFHVLRASATRMWSEALPSTHDMVAQIVRFNEAVDQILVEGVAQCTEHLENEADLFTATVAHDLANPLDAVMASAHLLGASRNLSVKEQAAVKRIKHAAGRLSNMVDDLRDYARIRLGGLVRIEGEPRDVGRLVREIVDELAAIYPDRDIVAEYSGDLTAHVDAGRIGQLVSNLVANALQHGTDTPRVAAYGDSDTVTIDVHNTGPAIDPQRLRTLFEPLRRDSDYTNRLRLGLGLYIAQRIALAHTGSIDVTSTDAAGTTFTVRLPRVQAATAAQHTTAGCGSTSEDAARNKSPSVLEFGIPNGSVQGVPGIP
jgi:signal transduction histidine kinase